MRAPLRGHSSTSLAHLIARPAVSESARPSEGRPALRTGEHALLVSSDPRFRVVPARKTGDERRLLLRNDDPNTERGVCLRSDEILSVCVRMLLGHPP